MLYVESASVIQTTLFPLNTNIPAANHDISYEIVSKLAYNKYMDSILRSINNAVSVFSLALYLG